MTHERATSSLSPAQNVAQVPRFPARCPHRNANPQETEAMFTTRARREYLRSVRAWVASTCEAWAISPEQRESLVSVVAEMVNNAVLHSRSPVMTVILTRETAGPIWVETIDFGRWVFAMPGGTGDEHPTSGRGVHLMRGYSDRVGVERGPAGVGTCVWALIPTPGE